MKRALPVVLGLSAALLGCEPDTSPYTITESRTVTRPDQRIDPSATTAARFGMGPMPAANAGAGAPQARGPIPLEWSMPTGWVELPPTDLRLANFSLQASPESECYLSVLPGSAGGVVGNINRWQKQMGQPDLTEAQIAALPKIPLLGLEATKVVIDGAFGGMSGTDPKSGYRMYGAVLQAGENSIFVKMTGPQAVLTPEETNFDAFCGSIRVKDDAVAAAPAEPPTSASDIAVTAPTIQQSTTMTWTSPTSWVDAGQKPMREATYTFGAAGAGECYISQLSGDAGGVLGNINRWCNQMGHAPLTEADLPTLPTVKFLGVDSPLVTLEGTFTAMDGTAKSDYMMIGTLGKKGDDMVFVKMVGPKADVEAEKTNFVAFCESIQ